VFTVIGAARMRVAEPGWMAWQGHAGFGESLNAGRRDGRRGRSGWFPTGARGLSLQAFNSRRSC